MSNVKNMVSGNPMLAKELSKCPIVAHGDRTILKTNR
jgi:hypothetical protein